MVAGLSSVEPKEMLEFEAQACFCAIDTESLGLASPRSSVASSFKLQTYSHEIQENYEHNLKSHGSWR